MLRVMITLLTKSQQVRIDRKTASVIPKIIHYCWFTKGDNKPLPSTAEVCLASWKKHCPDWEIKLWNESNFNPNANDFTREAYDAGKLGFVADYVRAFLLYTYGGVYMDTDLEVLQNMDFLRENEAFIGVENIFRQPVVKGYPGTALLGAEKGHPYFRAVMDFYEKANFINPDGSVNQWCTSNCVFNKIFVEMYGPLDPDTKCYENGNSRLMFYGKDVMYPHDRNWVKPESISLHHCMASWITSVSVVMPAYNAETTIAEAIESVLCQTFEKFELIIVDDGSTDSTRDIIKSFKDRRIVLIENGHDFIESLNLGMRRASGKYIARMDADDVMLPERLQIQYAYMESHPNVDLLGAGMQFFGESDYLCAPLEGAVTLLDMISTNCIAHPTVMIRRESLKKLPELYRKEYPRAEDYELWLRMLKAGMTLHNISDVVLRYRMSSSQVTARHCEEMWQSSARIREQYAPGLTVIIPFLNEGIEVERTVQSIRETAGLSISIILINDCSSDGYDYKAVSERYNCRYVQHSERKGVAGSRDAGVEMCQTPYFLLLDAHMEFYKKGWDMEISSLLQENPESILCCQTLALNASREPTKPTSTFGACLSLDRDSIFKCTWNYSDPDPEASVVPVPIILGGAYAASKAYWQHLHGLKGLINYGVDEELISMKCWTEGGRCLLLKNLVAGHIYRAKFPYLVKNDYVLHNKIFVAELFFDGEAKETVLSRIKKYYGEVLFTQVYDSMNRGLLDAEREYLTSISRKNLAHFLFKNAALR
jgi:glycosyltransferase involved in cell wall biosynthesis